MNLNEVKRIAVEEFGIVFPLTSDDFLKRRAAILKENHTDKGSKTSVDDFERIITVLNYIKENFDTINGFVNSGITSQSITRTGELLTELGKGLPNLVNGRKCHVCSGAGYSIQKSPIFGEYNAFCDCDHGYLHSAPCKYCNGTGKYHTKSGFDVKCKACDGTKVHVFKTPMRCPKCKTKRYNMFDYLFGYETIVGYRDEYHKCYTCNGVGELEIYNPVFQKGALNIGISAPKTKVTDAEIHSKMKRFNKIMNSIKK